MLAKNLLQVGLFCVELALVASVAVFRFRGSPGPHTGDCNVLLGTLCASCKSGGGQPVLSITLAYRMTLTRGFRGSRGSVGNGLLSLLVQLLVFSLWEWPCMPPLALTRTHHAGLAAPVFLFSPPLVSLYGGGYSRKSSATWPQIGAEAADGLSPGPAKLRSLLIAQRSSIGSRSGGAAWRESGSPTPRTPKRDPGDADEGDRVERRYVVEELPQEAGQQRGGSDPKRDPSELPGPSHDSRSASTRCRAARRAPFAGQFHAYAGPPCRLARRTSRWLTSSSAMAANAVSNRV